MEKLLKRAGAPRVSEDAKEALRDVLENYADTVSKKAVEFSKHAGRRTVKADDVKLAR
ncbi:histone [Candidatus Woesearchaeota archaeon]|nr:histone [Candidatus Woesearchaeota archaeon]